MGSKWTKGLIFHAWLIGSCWAFGTIGAIESIYAISTGELVSLSEQELLDCDSVSHGCSGGYIKRSFEWVIENGGINEEAEYPYVAQKGTCKANMVCSFYLPFSHKLKHSHLVIFLKYYQHAS